MAQKCVSAHLRSAWQQKPGVIHRYAKYTILKNLFPERGGNLGWGFHESPSYPHMYCFLAWRERIESAHKSHHVGTF